MDIFILVDQLIDIRREFSTSYMTFPSLYSPFWWISSSTAVVSLAPNAWPFPSHGYYHSGGTSHRHSSWVNSPTTWPFQVMDITILVGHLIDIRRELAPTTWPFHVIDTSILVGHLIDIRRELAPATWPFHVIDTSILVGHLIDIRRELAPTTWPFHVIDTSLLVGHLIDIRREFSTLHMTSPRHWYIHFGGTSHRHIRREFGTIYMTFPRHWYIHFGGTSHRHSLWV